MNDVAQIGERGMYFGDHMYEDVSKTSNLAWQDREWGLILGQNCVTSFMKANLQLSVNTKHLPVFTDQF